MFSLLFLLMEQDGAYITHTVSSLLPVSPTTVREHGWKDCSLTVQPKQKEVCVVTNCKKDQAATSVPEIFSQCGSEAGYDQPVLSLAETGTTGVSALSVIPFNFQPNTYMPVVVYLRYICRAYSYFLKINYEGFRWTSSMFQHMLWE